MKAITEKQRQWLWFAGLWGGGLVSVLLLAGLARLALKVL
jgi:hypothetical protein